MTVTTWLKQMPEKQQTAGKYLVGFFALVLALTLLSRGLDSYSVPMVSTTAVGSGSIGQQVKVQGSIEPLAQVAVSAPAGYLVQSMLVEEGAKVEEGDVLAVLSISHLEEKLEEAQRALEIARLNAVSAQLAVQEQTQDPQEKAVDSLDRAREDLERVKEDNHIALERAGRELYEARRERRELSRDGTDDDTARDEARKAVIQAEQSYEDALRAAEENQLKAQRTIEDAQRELDSAQMAKENQEAGDAVEQQKRSITGQIDRLNMVELEKKVEELEELLENEGKLLAPQSGLVTKLSLSAGSTTTGEGFLLLSDQSQGSLFRGTVEDALGEKLGRGDTGRLAISGETIDAAITALSAPKEKGDGYEVSAHLPDAALEPGTSGTLTVEKVSQTYPQVVPLSALSSKGNSTTSGYVYVVRERNTTLGVQWTVEQVEVEIQEQNTERAAISGVFERDDRIVYSSSRALSHGDRVRLEAEQ